MNLKSRTTTGGIVDVAERIFVEKANVYLSTPEGERLLLGLRDVSESNYADYFKASPELGSALSMIGIVDDRGLTQYGMEVVAQYDETI